MRAYAVFSSWAALAGMVVIAMSSPLFSLAGRVPARGELIIHPAGLQFEILEADPRRVKRLRIERVPAATE